MKTKLQQADELITRLATVILNEKIADHIPYGLVDEVKASGLRWQPLTLVMPRITFTSARPRWNTRESAHRAAMAS